MQLSLHADYSLRALIYLATHPGRKVTTREISDSYGISKHHLVRVVQTLSNSGYVQLTPGRSGGVTLAREPADIRLGEVFRDTEPSLALVECFDRETNTCPIAPACALIGYLHEALRQFIEVLNQKTLADMLVSGRGTKLNNIFVQIQTAKPVGKKPKAAGVGSKKSSSQRAKN